MKLLIGQILPYIAVVIFILGIFYRAGRWAGSRYVHNITISDPWLKSNGQVATRIGAEAFLFRNLFIHDKALWAGSFLMHLSLLMVLGGHVVGFGTLGYQFAIMPGISKELSYDMSATLGTVFGTLLFITLIYLLIRRFIYVFNQQISNPSDTIWLVYLLLLVGAGNIMRYFHQYHVEYDELRNYVINLGLFKPVVDMPLLDNPVFLIHFLLVNILIIVFPFSKLMHVLGMFAERWIVNRKYFDPEPGMPNIDVAAARRAGYGLPSTGGGEGGGEEASESS